MFSDEGLAFWKGGSSFRFDVVQSVKRLSNRLLHLSKINADSDLIELPALDGDPDGPVVSMEVLAISRIIP